MSTWGLPANTCFLPTLGCVAPVQLCGMPTPPSTWSNKCLVIDKLKLRGQNLGRVFNFRLSRACVCCATAYKTKWPSLKLKTWPKQLIGSLLLAFALPGLVNLFSDYLSPRATEETNSKLNNKLYGSIFFSYNIYLTNAS